MQKIKMIALGCGTLAIALGAGHFMQSRTTKDPVALEEIAPTPAAPRDAAALQLSSITLTSSVPKPPAAAMEPAILPDEPVREAALDDALAAVMTDALPSEEPAPSLACEYELSAAPAPGAMVALTLDARCAPGERFTLHHNGMMFTEVTDEGGQATMLVPALTKKAVFIAAFTNGEGAVANADVESLEFYQRAAVQWQGDAGITLHALEFGADYSDEGHVWANARRNVAAAADGDRGFLTRLGAADQPDALMAEIYTFPSQMSGRDGDVALQVDAEVTALNCNRDVEAQALQMEPTGTLKVQDLTLMMPGCDAVGDFLVLKNLLNDLTIARN
ncbi:hypothetical protein [Roseovarius arcticus]|uniref:hypothetical protein n=1 Tax=Roseovarius arcticus TaxID=2547404 RepID=UPI001110B10E|nr:hypothetical protein [Roseovarius arcticus]